MKKKWNKIVEEILKMDSDMSKLSDSELRHKTDEFKLRLKEGTSLDQKSRICDFSVNIFFIYLS